MARAVVDGLSFLGEPTRQTGVVFLTEQPQTSFRESLRRADLLDRDDFAVLAWRDCARLLWEDVAQAAIDECARRSAGLLIVDTLTRFAGISGDGENDAGKAEAAMAPLQIAAADGLSIVVTRHERKAGGDVGDSGRGSTAFGGAVDIILAIRRIDGTSNVRKVYGLSRFDETPDVLAIELTSDGYVPLGDDGAIALRDASASLLEILPADPSVALPMRALQDRTKASRATLQRALDGLVDTDLARRVGAGTRGNAYRWWAPIVARSGGDTGGTPWTLPWTSDEDDDYVVGTA